MMGLVKGGAVREGAVDIGQQSNHTHWYTPPHLEQGVQVATRSGNPQRIKVVRFKLPTPPCIVHQQILGQICCRFDPLQCKFGTFDHRICPPCGQRNELALFLQVCNLFVRGGGAVGDGAQLRVEGVLDGGGDLAHGTGGA